MKKMFTLQKVLFIIYILAVVSCFIFALSFMTDYTNLFALKKLPNAPIAHWHDVVMQNHNDLIFYTSIVGLISIIVFFVCEVHKKVCDKFAVILVNCMSGVTLIIAIVSLFRLPVIHKQYKALDFKYLELEALSNYEPIHRIFSFGMVFYVFIALAVAAFMATTIINYFKFKKLEESGVING